MNYDATFATVRFVFLRTRRVEIKHNILSLNYPTDFD